MYARAQYRPAPSCHLSHRRSATASVTRATVAKGRWQEQPDDPALFPDVPASPGHWQDLATYVHYTGPVRGINTATAGFRAWDRSASRARFALVPDCSLSPGPGDTPASAPRTARVGQDHVAHASPYTPPVPPGRPPVPTKKNVTYCDR